MKTPRQLLFDRHESAKPRLDAVRENVVSQITGAQKSSRAGVFTTGTGAFWREFLLPLRWHLAAASAVWVIAAFLHIERAAPATIADTAASPRQFAMTLLENRRHLQELLDSPAVDSRAEPQPVAPRKRSSLRCSRVIV